MSVAGEQSVADLLPAPALPAGGGRRGVDGWIAGALFLVTLLLFARTLSNGFLDYDDDQYVTANDVVQRGLTWQGVHWAFTTTHFANWLPVTWLSHMLDCQIWGTRPFGHHLTNALLHALNASLLFGFLRRATDSRWRSAAVAAVFAVHPLRVESVAWIAERKDLLAGTFFLLTIHAYVTYVRRPGVARYALVAVLLALGLMSKTMLVTAPCVLLLLDYWPLGRTRFGPAQERRAEGGVPAVAKRGAGWLVLEKLPLAVLAGVSSVWTMVFQVVQGNTVPLSYLTFWQRLANVLVSVPRYLGMVAWPVELCVFYPHPENWPAWAVVTAGGVIVGLTVLAIFAARRRAWVAVGWLWFLGMLVPVSGIVQVGAQSMADRYTYLPGIGLTILLAWSVGEFARRLSSIVPAGRVAFGALLLVFGALTWVQQGYWRDDSTLFQHALDVDERNWLAHNFIGNAAARRNDWNTAAAHYARSIELNPRHETARAVYGFWLLNEGRVEESIAMLRESLKLNPRPGFTHLWLGVALTRHQEIDQALAEFEIAAGKTPQYAEVYARWGEALAKVGRTEDARVQLHKALSFDPKHRRALASLRALESGSTTSTQPSDDGHGPRL